MNSTFVHTILVLLTLMSPMSFATPGPSEVPLLLQNLADADKVLIFPNHFSGDQKTVIVSIDSTCLVCREAIPQMYRSTVENLKTNVRWFFLVDHRTWPLARRTLDQLLRSPDALRNFYHDPKQRFRNSFAAPGEIVIFGFRGERLLAKTTTRPEKFKQTLADVLQSTQREGGR